MEATSPCMGYDSRMYYLCDDGYDRENQQDGNHVVSAVSTDQNQQTASPNATINGLNQKMNLEEV